MSSEELLHGDITDKILKAFYTVYNALGYGFLEKVYENAMILELRALGLRVERQVPLKIHYGQHLIGEYFADLVVEGKVIVELKSAETISQSHINQLQNYLKATDIEAGMLLNFGEEPKFKRKIFTASRKAFRKIAQQQSLSDPR